MREEYQRPWVSQNAVWTVFHEKAPMTAAARNVHFSLPCSVAGLGIRWTEIAYGDGHELQFCEFSFSPESDEADELERLW